jgi:hypothetical protein
MLPGRSRPRSDVSIEAILLRGDADRLSSWLGGQALPLEIEPGSAEVVAVRLAGPDGQVEIAG